MVRASAAISGVEVEAEGEAAKVVAKPALRPGLQEVYERHAAYVWQTLRRLGVPDRHLEDLTHDVFVIVHRQLGNFDPTKPLKPWLFGIAYRVAADHFRRASTQREVFTETESVDPTPPPDLVLEKEEQKKLVHRALLSLDLEQRTVFVLFEIEGQPAPAIAEVLDIPLNTVYSRVRLGRVKFERAMRSLLSRGHHD